jgi:riboflavin synthase
MFTGIISRVGRVQAADSHRLKIRASLPKARPGDSVSVNGACLTVTAPLRGGVLNFDVSEETWRLTNLRDLRPGGRVNLEPALRVGSALGGHFVSGHVDANGEILAMEPLPGGFRRLRVSLPSAMRSLVALKGSIAIDGISLTVTAVGRNYFETVLVPHTLKGTNLGARRKGESVNLEADLLARYVSAALGSRR